MLNDMSSLTDDEDIPQLPADTLQLLAEFQLEKDAREKQFEDLKQAAEAKFDDGKPLSMDLFGEDCMPSPIHKDMRPMSSNVDSAKQMLPIMVE